MLEIDEPECGKSKTLWRMEKETWLGRTHSLDSSSGGGGHHFGWVRCTDLAIIFSTRFTIGSTTDGTAFVGT